MVMRVEASVEVIEMILAMAVTKSFVAGNLPEPEHHAGRVL
jgi:hypothetical protein